MQNYNPWITRGIIISCNNKRISTWEIIKNETGKCKLHNSIEALMNKNTMVNNPQEIAQNFNDYFSTVASNIIYNMKKDDTNGRMGDTSHPSHLNYLNNNLNTTFTNITWKHTSTYEISKIIESLNTSNSCGYD
jgi:hypothetical protein